MVVRSIAKLGRALPTGGKLAESSLLFPSFDSMGSGFPDVSDRIGNGQPLGYTVGGGKSSCSSGPSFAVHNRLRAGWQAGYERDESLEPFDGWSMQILDRDIVPHEAQGRGASHVLSRRLFLLVEQLDKHAEATPPKFLKVCKRRVAAADQVRPVNPPCIHRHYSSGLFGLTLRFSGRPRSGPSAATGCYHAPTSVHR